MRTAVYTCDACKQEHIRPDSIVTLEGQFRNPEGLPLWPYLGEGSVKLDFCKACVDRLIRVFQGVDTQHK